MTHGLADDDSNSDHGEHDIGGAAGTVDNLASGMGSLGMGTGLLGQDRDRGKGAASETNTRTFPSVVGSSSVGYRAHYSSYLPPPPPPPPVAFAPPTIVQPVTHVHTQPTHHAPMLTEKPTPENLRDFEQSATLYFVLNRIPADQQTSHVAYNIVNPTIRDFYFADIDAAHAMSFKRFMDTCRAKLFGALWHKKWRREVMALKQGSLSFSDWSDKCKAKNAILRGTLSHLSDNELREHLTNNCHAELADALDANNCDAIVDFDDWMEAVQGHDENRRVQRARFDRWTREKDRDVPQKKCFTPAANATPSQGSATGSAPAVSATQSAGRSAWVPKLNDEEREYLAANDGCFRCRKARIGHKADKCEDKNRPSLATYKPYTVAMKAVVEQARARNPGKVTTAAVETKATTASVVEVPSAVLGDGSASEGSEYVDPFHSPHYFWDCHLDGPKTAPLSPVHARALIDNGSSTVLIKESLADALRLRRRKLPKPLALSLALDDSASPAATHTLTEWVKLKPRSVDGLWESRRINAIVSPSLCADIILGNPFLSRNHCIIDHLYRSCIAKNAKYDLLRPVTAMPTVPAPVAASVTVIDAVRAHADLLAQILDKQRIRRERLDSFADRRAGRSLTATLRSRIETLATGDRLSELNAQLRHEFADRFPDDIPHMEDLPTDVYHRFQLKDANVRIQQRQYASPRKYHEAWRTLLQQHLDAGRIRPSSSQYASPAFIIPKADPNVLPRWVNDYRQLNANTVPDRHPLPRIDDILADCAKGKIWGKIDMTNSFFQTRVHPDEIHLTAVTTPFGLYEWTVMPMGCRNAPATHQRRMFTALRHLIGKICHVYLDDIIIWSQTVEEHVRNVRLVLEALRNHSLFCSPKKTDLFCLELDFLGHHISARGIEADSKKADKILAWPIPKSTSHVRAFLGLVRYIATFLPDLARHTAVLNPLTCKEFDKNFPAWTPKHQRAFESIKQLVTSRACLTVINHSSLDTNRIFVTTDASDLRTGAHLSFGPSWKEARPVAFDSSPLNAAERNYPVHEKELLAIVCALKKWRVDLLGSPFTVYTDHRTLEHFLLQCDLSRRQARWQELLSQYDFTIEYIKGEDNTVADALSRFPATEASSHTIAATLTVTTDAQLLRQIKEGYKNDVYAKKMIERPEPNLDIRVDNGLLFVADRLVIPKVPGLRESLFRIAHDALGHFVPDKSYESLRTAYYWPHMRRDLEDAYIPSCDGCQRNKSSTSKKRGPLHPLRIPDARGDSVAINFIGPLPTDDGFNCLVTMTDRLNADIRVAPCRTDITAEDFAALFFNVWYCNNGLPLEIVSDRDRLFTSKFWKCLHELSGIKLKMSTAFHPQSDGASERSNKTVVQLLRFLVNRQQLGWVKQLPRIRFELMNTVNKSTGFSPFQLRLGRSPRVIPPLPLAAAPDAIPESVAALRLMRQIELDCWEAQDNLLLAKVCQSIQADKHRGREIKYAEGDYVMLNTLQRRRDYMQAQDGRVAKFMPRYDGKYLVKRAFPSASVYELELPNHPLRFAKFHASELKPYVENDDSLFPGRALTRPPPVVTPDGVEEWLIDSIIDERTRWRRKEYLVKWAGYGDDQNSWLPHYDVEECAALDKWLQR